MTWLVWRQHRAEYIALTTVLAVLGFFVLLTGLQMRNFEGGLACLQTNASAACGGQGDFNRQFSTYRSLVGWMNFLPAFVGLFIGAPLIARELERGTHRLIWTQGITRLRWLGSQLAGVMLAAVAVGVVFAVLMTWWRQPWDIIESRFNNEGYDFEGLMPVSTLLLATSLAVAAGTVLRRTLPAMATTLVAFLAVRLPVEFALRPHLMTPITTALPNAGKGGGAPAGAWVIDSGLINTAGNPVSAAQVSQLCKFPASFDCLSSHGFFDSVTYQPADRFWIFQGIECGIYVAIAIACLALIVWWVRRRAS